MYPSYVSVPSSSDARSTPRFSDNHFSSGADCPLDRKSTRLNSSHVKISYAVFCLKKKILTLLIQGIWPFARARATVTTCVITHDEIIAFVNFILWLLDV